MRLTDSSFQNLSSWAILGHNTNTHQRVFSLCVFFRYLLFAKRLDQLWGVLAVTSILGNASGMKATSWNHLYFLVGPVNYFQSLLSQQVCLQILNLLTILRGFVWPVSIFTSYFFSAALSDPMTDAQFKNL